MGPLVAAWLVHLYTGFGAILAFLAAIDIFQYRFRQSFLWLALAVFIDTTDGVFARRAHVGERLSWFDGAQLDNLVDFLTYVFVPALLVWRALLVPSELVPYVSGGMILSSAYGFSRKDAKTEDHFFTGFPSYWNIVVFYLLLGGATQAVNTLILGALIVLVFVPVRYVYPSRTPVLQRTTVTLGAVWAALVFVMLWQMPGVSPLVFWLSLLFPAYYTVLSFVLWRRRRVST